MKLNDRAKRRNHPAARVVSDEFYTAAGPSEATTNLLGSPFLLRDDSRHQNIEVTPSTPKLITPYPDHLGELSINASNVHAANIYASQLHATPHRTHEPVDPDRTVRRGREPPKKVSPVTPPPLVQKETTPEQNFLFRRFKRAATNAANALFPSAATPEPPLPLVLGSQPRHSIASDLRSTDSQSTFFTQSSSTSSAFVTSDGSPTSSDGHLRWGGPDFANTLPAAHEHAARARAVSLPFFGRSPPPRPTRYGPHIDESVITPPTSPEISYKISSTSLQSLQSDVTISPTSSNFSHPHYDDTSNNECVSGDNEDYSNVFAFQPPPAPAQPHYPHISLAYQELQLHLSQRTNSPAWATTYPAPRDNQTREPDQSMDLEESPIMSRASSRSQQYENLLAYSGDLLKNEIPTEAELASLERDAATSAGVACASFPVTRAHFRQRDSSSMTAPAVDGGFGNWASPRERTVLDSESFSPFPESVSARQVYHATDSGVFGGQLVWDSEHLLDEAQETRGLASGSGPGDHLWQRSFIDDRQRQHGYPRQMSPTPDKYRRHPIQPSRSTSSSGSIPDLELADAEFGTANQISSSEDRVAYGDVFDADAQSIFSQGQEDEQQGASLQAETLTKPYHHGITFGPSANGHGGARMDVDEYNDAYAMPEPTHRAFAAGEGEVVANSGSSELAYLHSAESTSYICSAAASVGVDDEHQSWPRNWLGSRTEHVSVEAPHRIDKGKGVDLSIIENHLYLQPGYDPFSPDTTFSPSYGNLRDPALAPYPNLVQAHSNWNARAVHPSPFPNANSSDYRQSDQHAVTSGAELESEPTSAHRTRCNTDVPAGGSYMEIGNDPGEHQEYQKSESGPQHRDGVVHSGVDADADWEGMDAAIEESRLSLRNEAMNGELSGGESSKSFSAFRTMHPLLPEHLHAFHFGYWLEWHAWLDRRAAFRREKAAYAARVYDSRWRINLMRPKRRSSKTGPLGDGARSRSGMSGHRRASSEARLDLDTVEGKYHTLQTPHASHFPLSVLALTLRPRPKSAGF
ncbi:hypothetical protein DL93DRAFT_2089766 [Clavulina sp. PMI_390]|nr:hypothetical protein DL93DRAFT_2089766 [Clavulina sp. PMI_390]